MGQVLEERAVSQPDPSQREVNDSNMRRSNPRPPVALRAATSTNRYALRMFVELESALRPQERCCSVCSNFAPRSGGDRDLAGLGLCSAGAAGSDAPTLRWLADNPSLQIFEEACEVGLFYLSMIETALRI